MEPRIRRALAAAIFVAGVLAAGMMSAQDRPQDISFSLVDQDGEARTDADFAGRYLIVFFGYTHCPDICPTSAQHMALLLDDLPADLKGKVVPVFVTGDPARDTPQVMKAFLASFDTHIVGLTGTEQSVDDLAWRMNAFIMRNGELAEGSSYIVDHSSDYILLRDGKLLGRFPMTTSTKEMISRISALAK